MRKPTPGYEKEYSEKAKTLDIMYYTPFKELKGYMNAKSPKQVIEYFERLEKCTCGGEPKVKQIEGMGELDTMIICKSCGRSINQSDYDRESSDGPGSSGCVTAGRMVMRSEIMRASVRKKR